MSQPHEPFVCPACQAHFWDERVEDRVPSHPTSHRKPCELGGATVEVAEAWRRGDWDSVAALAPRLVPSWYRYGRPNPWDGPPFADAADV